VSVLPSGTAERARSVAAAPVAAAVVLSVVSLAAVLANVISPHDPLAINPGNILESPGGTDLLGTDELGRDLFARIIHGGRVSLRVAFFAVSLASIIGIPLGIGIAFLGRRMESVAMRVLDVLVSLPEIFVAIVILAFAGGGLTTLIVTIGLLYVPQFARVAYGMTRSIRTREHVLAALSLGAGKLWIVRKEILPNIVSVIAVQASFTFSFAMLMEAGLSFLGLGVPPPTPSWGQMIGVLKDYIFINAWPVVIPSIVLLATVLSVNVLGDWLQDRLNPELQR
jgi:peptide/nickel transport system permease protein